MRFSVLASSLISIFLTIFWSKGYPVAQAAGVLALVVAVLLFLFQGRYMEPFRWPKVFGAVCIVFGLFGAANRIPTFPIFFLIPLFLIGRRAGFHWVFCAALTLLFLMNPYWSQLPSGDGLFGPDEVRYPAIGFAYYFWQRRNFGPMILCFLLSMAVAGSFPTVLAGFGLTLWLQPENEHRRRERIFGSVLLLAGLAGMSYQVTELGKLQPWLESWRGPALGDRLRDMFILMIPILFLPLWHKRNWFLLAPAVLTFFFGEPTYAALLTYYLLALTSLLILPQYIETSKLSAPVPLRSSVMTLLICLALGTPYLVALTK